MDKIYLLLDKIKINKDLKNCTILLGDETFYQDIVLNHYKRLLFKGELTVNKDDNIYHYEKINLEVMDNFQEKLYSGSFFSEVRLFIIKDSSLFFKQKHSEKFMENFSTLINNIPEDCYVVFIIDNLEKGMKSFKDYEKSKIYKALEQKSLVFRCNKPRYYEIKDWLNQEIRRRKLNISKEAYESIWQYCNYADNIDLSILSNEFEKIALYVSAPEIITRKKLAEISQISLQVSVFRLIEYLQKKDAKNILPFWQELFRQNIPIESIVIPLATQLKKIIHLKKMQELGNDFSDFSKEYKLSNYILNKLIKDSIYLSIDELKELHNEIVEFLYSLRNGLKEFNDFQFILIKFCNR